VEIAHSGDVAGFIFDPAEPDLAARMDEAKMLLATAGIAESWRFRTG
jgi:uncharacterized protein involved in propanediol utilization